MMGAEQRELLDPTKAARLEFARGTLRESMSALGNLECLLSSPSVGPKSVLALLPELQSSCAALTDAVATLLGCAGPALGEPSAATELARLVTEQCARIAHNLVSVGEGPFRTRQRLDLERAVRTGVEQLGPALSLVEVLDEAVWGKAMLVDLADVVRHAFTSRQRGSRPPHLTPALLVAPSVPMEVFVNPQVATRLVSLAGALLARSSGPPLCIEVRPAAAAGSGCLRFARRLGVGDELALDLPRVLPVTILVASAATRAIHGTFERCVATGEVTVTLPAPSRALAVSAAPGRSLA